MAPQQPEKKTFSGSAQNKMLFELHFMVDEAPTLRMKKIKRTKKRGNKEENSLMKKQQKQNDLYVLERQQPQQSLSQHVCGKIESAS